MPNAWLHWGFEDHGFLIAKVGKGSRTSAFRAVTALAEEIRQTTRIAMHRLFAIQGAAKAVRARARQNRAPYADLIDLDPRVVVATIRREMGPGWGHITVLHFLTDLGLACKPDLHLARTVRHLGMTTDLRDQRVPSLTDAITINRRVRSLVERMALSARHGCAISMDISARGLLTT